MLKKRTMKQIVLTPVKEFARDLIYTEQASLGRSLHLLLQDKGLEKYNYLLKIYRKIISDYNASSKIERAETLLRDFAQAANEIADEEGIIGEDLVKFDFYVVVCDSLNLFILTTSPGKILLKHSREFLPLAESAERGIKNLRLNSQRIQRELFSTRPSDVFNFFAVRLPADASIDLIIGCNDYHLSDIEESISSHLEESKPGEKQGRTSEIVSHLSNKVLFISFTGGYAKSPLAATAAAAADQGGASRRGILAVFILMVLCFVIAGYLSFHRGDSDKTAKPLPSNPEKALMTGAETGKLVPKKHIDGSMQQPSRSIELAEVWRRNFSMPVTSSPSVSQGVVFFGCRNGNFYAYNASTGTLKWRYHTKAGVGASPAIDGEKVVCADYKGRVFCLSKKTGSRLWLKKIPGKVVSSPVISAGKVFIGSYDHNLYCLSSSSGEILWKYKTYGIIRGTPSCSAGIVAFPSYDGYLYGVSMGTGSLRWKYKVKESLSSSPGAGGELVVIGGTDGLVHAIDILKGEMVWKTKLKGPIKSSVLITDESVYVGSNDTRLYCLDLATGSIIWEFKTGDLVLSRPFLGDNLILITSYDGNLYLLDSKTGKKISSFKASGSIFSSPALWNGLVFFGDNRGGFYALRLRNMGSS